MKLFKGSETFQRPKPHSYEDQEYQARRADSESPALVKVCTLFVWVAVDLLTSPSNLQSKGPRSFVSTRALCGDHTAVVYIEHTVSASKHAKPFCVENTTFHRLHRSVHYQHHEFLSTNHSSPYQLTNLMFSQHRLVLWSNDAGCAKLNIRVINESKAAALAHILD